MPNFLVRYAAPNGKVRTEIVDAGNDRGALAQIENKGFTPISVVLATGKQVKKGSAPPHGFKGGRALRRNLLDFTHQLAAVAESGIPIIAGLKAVAEQTNHAELKSAIGRIIGRIEGGRTLADALDGERGLFPSIYIKTIAAGEAAGKIPETLLALARYQEQEAETRSQVKSALLYPILVVGALVIATAFMLIFVVPQFAVMFEKFNGELPLPTRILMAASGAITRHYILLAIGLAGAFMGLRMLMRVELVRAWLDERYLKLPVFGNLLLGVYMVRFIELLDLLIQAALPITQSLRVTADAMTNHVIRRDVRGMLRSVEGGRSMTEAFSQAHSLTPLVKRMLAIGEQAGRTDQIFAYLRKYYTTQTQRSIKLLSTLIEPVLVGCLAAVVLFFALAIFLPMWKLLKLVGTA